MISATQACSSLREIKQLLIHNDTLHAVINSACNDNRYQLHIIAQQHGQALYAQLDCHSLLNSYGGGSVASTSSTLWVSDKHELVSIENDHECSRRSSITAGDLCTDEFFDRCLGVVEVDEQQHIIDCQAPDKYLISGADFYSSPCVSPDGRHLAFVCRNTPNMPWDNSELWICQLDQSGHPLPHSLLLVSQSQSISLKDGESINQPQWRNNSQLAFISDRSGYWGYYYYDLSTSTIMALYTPAAELCGAAWESGNHNVVLLNDGGILCSAVIRGRWQLHRVSSTGKVTIVAGHNHDSLCHFSQLTLHKNAVYFVAQSSTLASNIYYLNLADNSIEAALPPDNSGRLNTPPPSYLQFGLGESVSYGYFYPPTTASVAVPPLIVRAHGGPTSATTASLDLITRYFNERGFAVLDINYRGSTGYGRSYRHSLYGHWGVSEVEDTANAIELLASKKLIDPRLVFARGNSAGGYMTLCLATFSSLLAGGMVSAGISDLKLLEKNTHRFERFYIQQLLAAPYSPSHSSPWYQRSPIHFADSVQQPLLFVQGKQDNICPTEQAEHFITVLQKNDLAYDYLLFADEHHGIKKERNMHKALLRELAFYRAIIKKHRANI
ncbi:prolyl oligopeptidase family protein [Sinobacterium caligoides]|uniref:Acyl-peptide hydrolase n=1 Tax=Sinobacterium caligoides TaxID=933926 RepID=A0A3N2E352_9GAMM|nr:prolyl oligopeptidase family serine peptidase [Sinobacterium caligoides]ROS06139.1 prolyl oligopeptidase family protein [Sinobacterium caligoides]